MKILFALIVLFSYGATAQTNQSNPTRYSIEIFDQDYSMAYTIQYRVFDDSLTITGISGIVGEKDSCLMQKKIDKSQSEAIYHFLSSLNLKKLKSKYENPLIDDGDRKIVTICFKSINKTVEINNFYQEDMANLFKVVNQVIGPKLKIEYRNR
jgi:hypothetical protein